MIEPFPRNFVCEDRWDEIAIRVATYNGAKPNWEQFKSMTHFKPLSFHFATEDNKKSIVDIYKEVLAEATIARISGDWQGPPHEFNGFDVERVAEIIKELEK